LVLAIVDPEKGTKIGEISLSAHPESFQLASKGRRVFVSVPRAGHIAVVDRDKRAVTATWKISAASNFPMALAEEGHRLFVGCRQPARLLVLDTDSGKELASVECVGDAEEVFFEATTKRVFDSGGEGFLDVFSAEGAPKRQFRVATAAGARTCLLDSEAGALYLAVPHRGSQAAEVRVCKVRPEGNGNRADPIFDVTPRNFRLL